MASYKNESLVGARREWRRRLNQSMKSSNSNRLNSGRYGNGRKGANRIFLDSRNPHHSFRSHDRRPDH